MTDSKRIVINVLAQYIRTLLNVCLSLYSTRLILTTLGESDFGIYNVVAGIVTMLAFLMNALSITTQRFLSYSYGKAKGQEIHLIFGNSMLLHAAISLALLVILISLYHPIVFHVLNIEPDRQHAAVLVYIFTAIMLAISIITAPIRSLFIAHENIVYVSIIDVIDGVLKLFIAYILTYIRYDQLSMYGLLLIGVQLFNLCALGLYARIKFDEYHWPSLKEWNLTCIKNLASFAGWTVYSSGCIITRNQGIAILFNIFCGTIINAAYGIAQQVFGAVAFISSSIVNAINPQLMKAEGRLDREHMIRLAEYESKYAFLLLALVAIPLIFEMDDILSLWLVSVPKYTTPFCRLVLLAAVVDQLTIGLTSANQAIGKIRNYTLCFYTTKLLTLLLIWIGLLNQMNVASVLWFYVGIEFIGSIMRLPLLKYEADINIMHFCKQVFLREVFPFLTICLISYVCVTFIQDYSYRFLLTFACTVIGGLLSIGLTALDKQEKEKIHSIIIKYVK